MSLHLAPAATAEDVTADEEEEGKGEVAPAETQELLEILRYL